MKINCKPLILTLFLIHLQIYTHQLMARPKIRWSETGGAQPAWPFSRHAAPRSASGKLGHVHEQAILAKPDVIHEGSSTGCWRMGMVKVKVVPFPDLDSTQMRPP
jgi:hypothetical protein